MSDEKKKGIKAAKVGAGAVFSKSMETMNEDVMKEAVKEGNLDGYVTFDLNNDLHSDIIGPDSESPTLAEAMETHRMALEHYIEHFLRPAAISLMKQGIVLGCPADQIKVVTKSSAAAFDAFVHKNDNNKNGGH